MTPKRGAYPREVREEAIRMLRAGREMNDVARELGVTTTSLKVWTHIADGGRHGPDLSRDAIMRATIKAYDGLELFLASVPASALSKPMAFAAEAIDPWCNKDAVAHLTHYKARAIHRLTKGRDPVLDEYFDSAVWAALEAADHMLPTLDDHARRRHGLNHLVYERWCDRPAREIVAFHRTIHEHVISALESGPEAWFGIVGSPPRIPRTAIGALAHHYTTHLKDMRRALGKDVRSARRG